jgi:methylmalonyl-CoA mutase N-terminal domain/subunit
VVGVNRFTESDEEALDILHIGQDVEDRQLKRLDAVKHERDSEAVAVALRAVQGVARQADANVMPVIIDAVRAYATIGEIVDSLASVFGRWTEDPII